MNQLIERTQARERASAHGTQRIARRIKDNVLHGVRVALQGSFKVAGIVVPHLDGGILRG